MAESDLQAQTANLWCLTPRTSDLDGFRAAVLALLELELDSLALSETPKTLSLYAALHAIDRAVT